MSLIFFQARVVSPELPSCFHYKNCRVGFPMGISAFSLIRRWHSYIVVQWTKVQRNTLLSAHLTISRLFLKSLSEALHYLQDGAGVSWWVPIPLVFAPISLRYFQFSKCFTFSCNPTPLHVLFPHSQSHLPCKTKLNDPWTINRFSFALCASLHFSPHHVLLKLPNSTVRFLRLGLAAMLQPSPLPECLAWCQAQK